MLATTVTYLEIRAPQTRGSVLPDGLTFAPLSRDIYRYRDLFRRIGADWLWCARLNLSDAALTEILTDDKVHLYTLLKNDRPEALLELDFRTPEECELAYFGLTPSLIGTGAGSYLMDRAIVLAFAQDITRLHVHTCTLDSPQALGFYTRSGFTPIRQEIEIMADPRLTGALPRDCAPHIPIF